MARIGLNNFRYGILTEAQDGTATYGVAKKPAKAISCNVSITNNDAKLFADDGLAESDTSFQSGTATVGIDEDDTQTMADLLGHSVVDGVLTRNSNDVAPYVGFGRVIVKMVNGVYKYKVEFLKKVKFGEPSQEDTTKGESVEFGTTEIEGTVATLADGSWSITKTFDSKADAITYLESLFGGTPTTYEIIYNVNGGSGSIAETVTVVAGESVELDDGSGLTPPSNTTFGGWSKTPNGTTAVASPYTPSDDTTLYAIWVANE